MKVTPQYILRRLRFDLCIYPPLQPYGPVASPLEVTPDRDPIYKELMRILSSNPLKPQKKAYECFKQLLHPLSFPVQIQIRASRWTNKYFNLDFPLETANMYCDLVAKCNSPFFAGLVLRTLVYGWTTGTRFSNSVSARKCPYCNIEPERLSHLLTCPSMISLLAKEVNKLCSAHGVFFGFPIHDSDALNEWLPLLLPVSPTSHAHLLLLALSFDLFHATKEFSFLSNDALAGFICSRVQLSGRKFGKKFWASLSTRFPFPSAPPPLRRRRRRHRHLQVFAHSCGPPFDWSSLAQGSLDSPPSPLPSSVLATDSDQHVTLHPFGISISGQHQHTDQHNLCFITCLISSIYLA